jgi:type I site-specific restriction endonuclease
MNKKELSERDICTKFITPALRAVGWDEITQLREEVSFTKGRIIVRGKLVTRGKAKRADYILYYKPNIPLAVIEAKDNNCSVGDGMQQALGYAETLQIPFVFSSNGDGFVFHDATVTSGAILPDRFLRVVHWRTRSQHVSRSAVQAMKVNYFPETDSLYIDLSERLSVESREISEGVVLDYDETGSLVGIDIDNASEKVQLHKLVVSKFPAVVETTAS